MNNRTRQAIQADLLPFGQRRFMLRVWHYFTGDIAYYRAAFCRTLRVLEDLERRKLNRGVRYFLLRKRKNKIGIKFGWEIPLHCCGEGLHLCHANVVVSGNARVGKNALFHGNNCIGRKDEKNNSCAIIGDDCEFGFGAVVCGRVVLADRTIIGANSTVIDSFCTPGTTIVGSPARAAHHGQEIPGSR